ncbi:MAG: ATP-dependent 6-phosphofructokinase 1 [Candidatus Binatia bacterium]|nr:MAG: ATP-dependent 6-phosphofructokinase 1 [Candidatus Binatia bacterium]
MRKIGVLCSGGDAPGMNAAIRAVVRRAASLELETTGIRNGYAGLLRGELVPLGPRDVGNIVQFGGTILGTARSREFYRPEGRARAAQVLREAGIEGLVVIGGDGSYRGAQLLAAEHGIHVVGIPGTIDNDIPGTDATIGFDTAVNTALDAIDRLRDTAEALGRLFFVEVMGRSTGFLAAHVALAGGADQVLVPEVPTDIEALCRRIRDEVGKKKRSAIVVVAEGDDAGGAVDIARRIKDDLSIDSRVCVLGHIQRGGKPTARDRILAARLGARAVEALAAGRSGVAVGERKGVVVEVPFDEVFREQKPLELEFVDLAEKLSG